MKRLPARLLIGSIRVYRALVSPLLPPSCRFTPSCSHYAQEAIEGHGALRGSLLGLRRILRCHPWSPGGHDPVPPRAEAPNSNDSSSQPVEIETRTLHG